MKRTGKHTRYFWLSYYDTSLTRPETLEFDTTKTGKKYMDCTAAGRRSRLLR